MTVFYSDNDTYVAQWLGNLCAAGHLPQGTVDARSILEIEPAELGPFRQCHFFAGIGGWPYALAIAEWPEDREVWTASCPCQPVSSAGQRRGHADERHIWPALYRLIAECRPATIFGEQVASKDGREWLAGVRADLEAIGYAVGCADLCAAGVGAPHIRQRLFWVANASGEWRGECGELAPAQGNRIREISREGARLGIAGGNRAAGGLGNTTSRGCERRTAESADAGEKGPPKQKPGVVGECQVRPEGPGRLGDDGAGGGLGNAFPAGLQEQRGNDRVPSSAGTTDARETAERAGASVGRLGNAAEFGFGTEGRHNGIWPSERCEAFWSDAIWLSCLDGKARRIEPGIQPLAHGVPARVGRLRAYGNAIVPQVAAQFVRAFLAIETATQVATPRWQEVATNPGEAAK